MTYVPAAMQVAALIQREVTTCSDRDQLHDVANLMWKHDIGCLPVLGDGGRVIGMITDRDVCMAAYLQAAPLRSIAVSSAMSREIVSCKESDDVLDVGKTMRSRQIRRVPVVDDRGALVGMITLNDLARAAHEGKLPAAEIAQILVAISHPRLVHPSVG